LEGETIVNCSFSFYFAMVKISQPLDGNKVIFESGKGVEVVKKIFLYYKLEKNRNAQFIEGILNHQGLFLQFYFIEKIQ